MDPQQTAALNALAPYLALSASANSPAAAATCIAQAIGAPHTFVFAELLSKQSVQALREADHQHARWLKVLEIFSWGTWNDYQATQGLPELSDAQATKLRLLTIVTLAQSSPKNLTYESLLSSLSLDDVTTLQALLTQAIYAGLLIARLNPRMQRVDLVSVAPLRDLAPGKVSSIMELLTAWEGQCVNVYREIEERISTVKSVAQERQSNEAARKAQIDQSLTELTQRGSKREGDVLGEIQANNGSKRGGHHGFLAGRQRFS